MMYIVVIFKFYISYFNKPKVEVVIKIFHFHVYSDFQLLEKYF